MYQPWIFVTSNTDWRTSRTNCVHHFLSWQARPEVPELLSRLPLASSVAVPQRSLLYILINPHARAAWCRQKCNFTACNLLLNEKTCLFPRMAAHAGTLDWAAIVDWDPIVQFCLWGEALDGWLGRRKRPAANMTGPMSHTP